jgi:hypothetical protein
MEKITYLVNGYKSQQMIEMDVHAIPAGSNSGSTTVNFKAIHARHVNNGCINPNEEAEEACEQHGAAQTQNGDQPTEEGRGPPAQTNH